VALKGLIILAGMGIACGLWAGDLAAPSQAKFLRVVVQATGSTGVACASKELAGELTTLNVTLNPGSKVIWVESDKEIGHLVKEGRIVVCGSHALLVAGACLAVVAEGGRPVIYVNPKALAAAGATLPDNIMKIAKVAQ